MSCRACRERGGVRGVERLLTARYARRQEEPMSEQPRVTITHGLWRYSCSSSNGWTPICSDLITSGSLLDYIVIFS